MLPVLPLVALLLVACSSTAEERTGEAVSASSDGFLKLGGVEGESKESGRPTVWSFAVQADGSGNVEWLTDCVGPFCHLAVGTATLQSGEATADGPTSVWEIPDAQHLIVRGDDGDPTIQAKLTGGSVWSTLGAATPITGNGPHAPAAHAKRHAGLVR